MPDLASLIKDLSPFCPRESQPVRISRKWFLVILVTFCNIPERFRASYSRILAVPGSTRKVRKYYPPEYFPR